MRQIQRKLVLLRVSGEFELPRVRIIGVQLYIQYETESAFKIFCAAIAVYSEKMHFR